MPNLLVTQLIAKPQSTSPTTSNNTILLNSTNTAALDTPYFDVSLRHPSPSQTGSLKKAVHRLHPHPHRIHPPPRSHRPHRDQRSRPQRSAESRFSRAGTNRPRRSLPLSSKTVLTTFFDPDVRHAPRQLGANLSRRDHPDFHGGERGCRCAGDVGEERDGGALGWSEEVEG